MTGDQSPLVHPPNAHATVSERPDRMLFFLLHSPGFTPGVHTARSARSPRESPVAMREVDLGECLLKSSLPTERASPKSRKPSSTSRARSRRSTRLNSRTFRSA